MKKKKKRKTRNLPLIFVSVLVIFSMFSFSVHWLSTSVFPTIFESKPTSKEKNRAEFIQTILPTAKQLQQKFGILPSIILGQAILESNWGESQLASKYKNLFGIKAYGDQPKISLDTQEFVNDKWVTIKGTFRVYSSWDESLEDHTKLLVHGVSWNKKHYEKVLKAPNYKLAAIELQNAGYATDPDYAKKIQQIIETYDLSNYD